MARSPKTLKQAGRHRHHDMRLAASICALGGHRYMAEIRSQPTSTLTIRVEYSSISRINRSWLDLVCEA